MPTLYKKMSRVVLFFAVFLLTLTGGLAAEAAGNGAYGLLYTENGTVQNPSSKYSITSKKKKKNKNKNKNKSYYNNNNYSNNNSKSNNDSSFNNYSNYSNNNNNSKSSSKSNSSSNNRQNSYGSGKNSTDGGTPEDGDEELPEVEEDGTYTSKEEVALYIHLFSHLPDNYITKDEARDLGWVSSWGNLDEVAPGKSIGGDRFGNYEGLLPEKKGRKYYECDIDHDGGYRGAKRIIFSNDGLIYYTEDHYKTFELLYDGEDD